ncbi:MAG: serine/threonine-protein kinase [Planctomycetaceae bacterium]
MNCDQVRQSVLDGRLMPADTFGKALSDWLATNHGLSDGEGLVGLLVRQQLLTEFQASGLLAAIPGPYRLGPYEVFDRVAAGRLGMLFRARHPEFDQAVALKIFPVDVTSDRDQTARLTRELRIDVMADHPNVVRTYQVGRAGRLVYAALEDLQGETLATRLKREAATATPSLPLGEACRLIREAALGMSYLHEMGVVLRDVQPANLWVTSAGHIKIMEFGAAHDSLEFLDDADPIPSDQADELRWNFDYVSPELGGDAPVRDGRGDIYSLGCVAFHCLTGRVVFPDKNPLRKMIRHARDPAPFANDINSSLPQPLVELLAKMLSKYPANRPATALLVAEALEPFCSAADVDADIDALASVAIRPNFLDWVGSLDAFDHVEEIPPTETDPALIDFIQLASVEFGSSFMDRVGSQDAFEQVEEIP